jgi:hypothetical protein
MTSPILYSIIESPTHPDLTSVYADLGYEEMRLFSMRKAIAALKKCRPEVVVAEFFYGFGNNYAGVNVSNLDVFLASLRKYSSSTRVIVMAGPADLVHVEKLAALFELHSVLAQPVSPDAMYNALTPA